MERLGMLIKVGTMVFTGLLLIESSAQAQYGGYAGGGYADPSYRPVTRGVSVQIGVGAVAPVYQGYQAGYGGNQAGYGGNQAGYGGNQAGYGGYQAGYSGYQGGYQPAPNTCGTVGGGVGYGGYPSPATRQGYREGKLYYETGIAPNRPLSPAEAQGFQAGEHRAASTPWQLDPARQQGYREGQYYYETGLAPNRPLSPAEAQGFQAGERRASTGNYNPYR